MFTQGTSLQFVKKKLLPLPWLTFEEERNFPTGETNLYYSNGGDRIAIYFDNKKKYIAGERIPTHMEEIPLF